MFVTLAGSFPCSACENGGRRTWTLVKIHHNTIRGHSVQCPALLPSLVSVLDFPRNFMSLLVLSDLGNPSKSTESAGLKPLAAGEMSEAAEIRVFPSRFFRKHRYDNQCKDVQGMKADNHDAIASFMLMPMLSMANTIKNHADRFFGVVSILRQRQNTCCNKQAQSACKRRPPRCVFAASGAPVAQNQSECANIAQRTLCVYILVPTSQAKTANTSQHPPHQTGQALNLLPLRPEEEQFGFPAEAQKTDAHVYSDHAWAVQRGPCFPLRRHPVEHLSSLFTKSCVSFLCRFRDRAVYAMQMRAREAREACLTPGFVQWVVTLSKHVHCQNKFRFCASRQICCGCAQPLHKGAPPACAAF